MAPKKNVKMDLGSFLADDTYGGTSWADEEVDLNSIGLSLDKSTTEAPIGGKPSFSGLGGGEGRFQEQRKERKEYPVPDKPPYVARVSNLPWEVTEEVIVRHFEDRMQAHDIITDIRLPVDRENGRLKGYAFVTFTERGLLEESLNLTLSEFQGRKIYVNVAAPPRADEGDWRSGRSGPLGGRGEPEVDLDWGSARRTQAELPRRERSSRGPREERSSGPDLDWGAARSDASGLPPRERSHRGPPREHKPRDEPDLDWGAARSELAELPPREKSHRGPPREHKSRDEPELDWGSVRSSHVELPPRQRSSRTSSHGEGQERGSFSRAAKKQEPELDWGAARSSSTTLPPRERSSRSGSTRKNSENDFDWKRGQPLQQRTKPARGQKHKDDKKEEEKSQGPQKSQFSVLSVDDGDDDEEEESEAKQENSKQESDDVSKLESATANLSVSEKDNNSNDDWEVVGKK
ncbi:RNA recognition motif family protein [Candida parapsilosis]|uniref:RRM domain-containing protein n=2 Tax=Candida parapsilosis TaxID=5480 RepID=G8B5E4_CANPC|nr:uncharacterized protein CPAR2_602550 [Candida parapsilosis]KAF6043500.1 RNA recognition motif family protein [Candida parapsilosis]KAF6044002.1 RNA recognition motif family protein [Candida parapsilosis]KAF6045378.1 RNA recognition motif family protein [Candida parapsilosis]KAF6060164.1 RNA recognition motif family protein [Candida parapsilosis]KAI5901585.1 Eukaryotic translation initiation factor 4B [Candida parapsilosis]